MPSQLSSALSSDGLQDLDWLDGRKPYYLPCDPQMHLSIGACGDLDTNFCKANETASNAPNAASLDWQKLLAKGKARLVS